MVADHCASGSRWGSLCQTGGTNYRPDLPKAPGDANTKSTGKRVEALKEAPKRGWLVVDMKQDWNTIFRPESR
jgi:hypothetical protein